MLKVTYYFFKQKDSKPEETKSRDKLPDSLLILLWSNKTVVGSLSISFENDIRAFAKIWGTISNINKVRKYDNFATA